MQRIKRAMRFISDISTGTLIACIIWCGVTLITQGRSVFEEAIPYITLAQILLLGIICGIGTELIIPDRDMSSKEEMIRIIIHGIFITASVLILGLLYEWYKFSVGGVLLMCLTSAVIYAATTFVNYQAHKKTADEMTERLNEIKMYRDK